MAAVDKTYGDALFSLVTEEDEKALPDILGPVSYTHLTLPTIYSV